MMTAVHDAILSVDILILMRDASVSTGNGDKFVLDLIKQSENPAILVLNKIDKIKEKHELLPLIEFYSKEYEFAEIIPVSALRGEAVNTLLAQITKHLPVAEAIFNDDELTDQPMRVLVAEMVREQILMTTGEEIPYVTAVVTEVYDESDQESIKIFCAIYVERDSQKGIIIGKGGIKLKKIGTEARVSIEKIVNKKVFLKLFVKVVADWRNSRQNLDDIGVYESR